jgi:hypothetical protein
MGRVDRVARGRGSDVFGRWVGAWMAAAVVAWPIAWVFPRTTLPVDLAGAVLTGALVWLLLHRHVEASAQLALGVGAGLAVVAALRPHAEGVAMLLDVYVAPVPAVELLTILTNLAVRGIPFGLVSWAGARPSLSSPIRWLALGWLGYGLGESVPALASLMPAAEPLLSTMNDERSALVVVFVFGLVGTLASSVLTGLVLVPLFRRPARDA